MKTIYTSNKPNISFTIDDESYLLILEHNNRPTFCINNTNHISFYSRTLGKKIMLARFLINLEDFSGTEVDHIDRNTLNNQLSNLREVDRASNLRNRDKQQFCTSDYRCVDWNKSDKRWRVRVRVVGKRISAGNFTDEKNAAIAADDLMLLAGYDLKDLNFPTLYGA